MLMKFPAATAVHPSLPRQTPPVTMYGHVMKGRLSKRQRARLAAKAVRRDTDVAMTAAMASRAFMTTEYLVKRELEGPVVNKRRQRQSAAKPTPVAPTIDEAWSAMAPEDRDQFICDHLAELWNGFDRVTTTT